MWLNISKGTGCWNTWFSAPPSKNAVSAFPISCKLLSFTLEVSWRNLQIISCSSITKGSICHISHMYIQPLLPFTTVVAWPEMRCLMEVSTMFNICRYCVFTWDGSFVLQGTGQNITKYDPKVDFEVSCILKSLIVTLQVAWMIWLKIDKNLM